MEMWKELSFSYQMWFLVAFGLGSLQLMTDEFFFGGACIGALLTGIVLFAIEPGVVVRHINPSLPYVLCGVGGLLGAVLMRRACRDQLNAPDINEEPYESDRR